MELGKHPLRKLARALGALLLLLGLGFFQAARAQDMVYAAEWNQGDNEFGTINLYTGTFTEIGTYGSTIINDIAYAPDGTVYGIENSTSLVTFNLQNAAITTIGNFNADGIETLAFQPGTGDLYAASQGALYTVDPTTGAATLVGNFGDPTGLDNNGQNIRFAPDGVLYDTNTSTNGMSTGLYNLSLTSGSATYLGEVQGYPNLALANAGNQMYGVAVNVTGSSTTQQTLIAFNIDQLEGEASPENIDVIPLDGEANIPENFNFSGAQDAADPGYIEAAPEISTFDLMLLSLALLAAARRRKDGPRCERVLPRGHERHPPHRWRDRLGSRAGRWRRLVPDFCLQSPPLSTEPRCLNS